MVGYMPDSFGYYDNMRVREYLDFFARAYGICGQERMAAIVAEELGIRFVHLGLKDEAEIEARVADLLRQVDLPGIDPNGPYALLCLPNELDVLTDQAAQKYPLDAHGQEKSDDHA